VGTQHHPAPHRIWGGLLKADIWQPRSKSSCINIPTAIKRRQSFKPAVLKLPSDITNNRENSHKKNLQNEVSLRVDLCHCTGTSDEHGLE